MASVIRAPEIDRPGLAWFNVPGPLSLAALRGRLVILDFWTLCCINCIHVIPTLRRIEERFPDEVVVIGVHSPKFAAERDPENVRAAIRRYGVAHPVAHDPELTLWRAYAVRAWPTLVFVGPDGRVLGQTSGEPDPDALERAVAQALAEARRGRVLAPAPLPLTSEEEREGLLSFPGKIKPVPGGVRRWALADGGHHQIVLLDDGGRELRRFGDGRPGFRDGPAPAARFDSPQGLIATADAIFVADTANHAIRRIDLADGGAVATLAGAGRRGGALRGRVPAAGASPASPWDLELCGRRLLFANAGTHQIGELDLDAAAVRPLAGTGGENIVDGPAADALLAQPSGLALDPSGDTLFFVDSETSAVRAVLDLDGAAPRVATLVGAGLFEFGHRNGPFEHARLQHPLGLCRFRGGLLVADSYNGEARVLDLVRREVSDLDGGRFTCQDPVCLPLGEPAGVWADGEDPDRVLLVDTNNHRVLEYRLGARAYRTWLA